MKEQPVMNSPDGFTLVELLVTLAITSIVMTGVLTAFHNQQQAHMKQQQVVAVQQNVRTAMYLIAREIRMAGYDPDETGDYGITAAGNGSENNPLEFSYDNGTTGGARARIRLFDSTIDLNDTADELQLTVGGTPAAENIDTLVFTYLDQAGLETTDLDEIRAIRISITARPDERERNLSRGSAGNRHFEMTVKCRNLGLF